MVVVGVAFELGVIFFDFCENLHAFRRATIRSPERPSVKKLLFEVFACALVVVGVSGEFFVARATEDIGTELRIISNERVGVANKEAGDARKEAADTSLRAATLEKESVLLWKQLLSQDRRANVLMNPNHRRQFVSRIQQFSGQNFDVVSCGIKDSEIISFSMAVWTTLDGIAKWKLGKIENNSPSCGPGMLILVNTDAPIPTKKAAEALLKAFIEQGLMKEGSTVGTLSPPPAGPRGPETWFLETSHADSILVLLQIHE
jgi:hypothetical protein